MIDLRHGDMRDVLPTIEADSVHSVVTDPPYELAFMGRHWDQTGVAFQPDTWRAVHRVLRPGGYLLAMGGTRTFHRLACAIEDAGFEVRDTIAWVYGSGFPKSLDISKAIDRAAGAEREVVGSYAVTREFKGRDYVGEASHATSIDLTAPATDAARQWNGWGTALKPAMEMICVARKPLSERTVAGNVLRHGTGGINVDACRVAGVLDGDPERFSKTNGGSFASFNEYAPVVRQEGRWPANLCHDGSPEVEAAFAAFGDKGGGFGVRGGNTSLTSYGFETGTGETVGYGDSGSPSRFFYSAKAASADRADSRHPTVKPVELLRWMVRLVTPKGGTILDPFAGSGTTGEAAMLEGFNAILIEREAEHAADIAHRQRRWHGGDLPLFAEAAD